MLTKFGTNFSSSVWVDRLSAWPIITKHSVIGYMLQQQPINIEY